MRYIIHPLLLLLLNTGFTTGVKAQDADRFYKLSQEQMRKGDFREALNSIDEALAIDTSKADYFLQKATLYYHLSEYKDALRQCYSANKIEPDKPQVHYLRGLLCLATESYGGAIFFFGKVIKLSDDNEYIYKAYIGRGKTYLNTSKFNEAVTDFVAADNLKPDSIEASFLLAEAYFKLKESDKAQPLIEKVISVNPNVARAYKILGNIHFVKKDFTKAMDAFNKYCTLNANDAEIYQLISNLHLQNKDYDKAQIAIDKAIHIEPAEPLNFKILSIICMEKGQNEEGCNSLFKAFQLGYLEKYGYDALDVYLTKCEGK